MAAHIVAAIGAGDQVELRRVDMGARGVQHAIVGDMHRQHAAEAQRDALSPAQRELVAAIADVSILARDVAGEDAGDCEPTGTEAASARACG